MFILFDGPRAKRAPLSGKLSQAILDVLNRARFHPSQQKFVLCLFNFAYMLGFRGHLHARVRRLCSPQHLIFALSSARTLAPGGTRRNVARELQRK